MGSLRTPDIPVYPAYGYRHRPVSGSTRLFYLPLFRYPVAGGGLLRGRFQSCENLGDQRSRARRTGGVGNTKTIGNYAASLYAGEEAHKAGYTQVLWLDGIEQKYIEEVGAMNIFFVIGDEIVTPELSGSILPGITRKSVIALARHWGMQVSERKISIDEVMEAHGAGTLKEIFGSGTAAVISPVGELKYGDRVLTIGNGSVGPTALKLFESLCDIQYGTAEDPMAWIEPV
jgi:branched-chain amino acid aminotransferase